MVLEHSSYRHYLKSELANRIGRNPAYSMRAFAQQLGVSHTLISLVMKGQRNISAETCLQLSQRLGLKEHEAEYFQLLVQLENARIPELKDSLLRKLDALHPSRKNVDLAIESFRVISDWYHFALLRLTEIPGTRWISSFLGRRLGIAPAEADLALERLKLLRLIEEDPDKPGSWRKATGSLYAQAKGKNPGLRKFNRQVLEKAIASLEDQPPEDKVFGTEMIAISKKDLPEAEKLTRDFLARMLELARNSKHPKSDVYQVAVQMFNLTNDSAGASPERNENP
jgi:uncharacterized protein (TIGR02147 family)